MVRTVGTVSDDDDSGSIGCATQSTRLWPPIVLWPIARDDCASSESQNRPCHDRTTRIPRRRTSTGEDAERQAGWQGMASTASRLQRVCSVLSHALVRSKQSRLRPQRAIAAKRPRRWPASPRVDSGDDVGGWRSGQSGGRVAAEWQSLIAGVGLA